MPLPDFAVNIFGPFEIIAIIWVQTMSESAFEQMRWVTASMNVDRNYVPVFILLKCI